MSITNLRAQREEPLGGVPSGFAASQRDPADDTAAHVERRDDRVAVMTKKLAVFSDTSYVVRAATQTA